MKCLPILVLVILSLIVIVSIVSIERDYHRASKRRVSVEEGFDNIQGTNDGEEDSIQEKEIPEDKYSELRKQTGTNLIGNGSFQNKHDTQGHFGSYHGNEIIELPNPGKSKYVLKQSVSIHTSETQYKIAVKVEPTHYYKLSCWLRDSEKDANDISEVYTLIYHLKNNNSVTYHPKAVTIQTKAVGGKIWYHQNIIFQISNKSNGNIDIVLPFNNDDTAGHRYITGLWMERYHPLLKGFPKNGDLAFFLSSNIESGFDKNPNKLWFDISNNAKNFLFSKVIPYSGHPINLEDNQIIGPACSELGIKIDSFTIGWYASCKHMEGKQVFMKLFTSAESGSILEIAYVSNHPNYTSLEINFLNKKTTWDIGILANYALYQLGYNNQKFSLYKDGLLLTSKEDESGHTGHSESSEPPNSEFPEGFSGEGSGHDQEHLYFINKPLLINPNKNIQGSLSNIFAYPTVLSKEDSESVNRYFQCSPCKQEHITRPVPHFPIEPVHEEDIHEVIEETHETLQEEDAERERLCKIILEKEDQEKREAERERKIAIFCDAHNVRQETPNESQNIVNRLVTTFNNKENEMNDPCTKITYQVRADGKVVRKKYRLPNCDKCVVENPSGTPVVTNPPQPSPYPGSQPTPYPTNLCPQGLVQCRE